MFDTVECTAVRLLDSVECTVRLFDTVECTISLFDILECMVSLFDIVECTVRFFDIVECTVRLFDTVQCTFSGISVFRPCIYSVTVSVAARRRYTVGFSSLVLSVFYGMTSVEL